jgi:hypothetical protein
MTSLSPLERLAGPGTVLAKEPPDAQEFDGLVRSGLARLKDAGREANSLYSRFDLAYSAAHALCLAALRYRGFRPSKRYIVFQVVPDTLRLCPESGGCCQSVTTCATGPSMKGRSVLKGDGCHDLGCATSVKAFAGSSRAHLGRAKRAVALIPSPNSGRDDEAEEKS